MGRVDAKRLSLHAGTLRPVQRFDEKAALAAGAGFGAWALRGVELEGYLAEGRTIDEVRQLNEKHGLAISETGSLMQWQLTGGVPLLNLSQALWREDPLAVARRCHAGAVKVLESV